MNDVRDALRTALASGKTVQVFFRDDDIDEDEATLRRLLQLFAARNIPLVLGVIPARLTTDCIALLQSFSATIELVQHGWQHVNHETSDRKCEFGPSRSFAEQLDDLSRGQSRMNEAFGAHWFPAFIPPWNRCTEVTEQALRQLGFQVLSKLREPHTTTHLPEISVTLDLFRWKDGAQLKPAAELWRSLAQQIQSGHPLGIMLHHKVMADEAFAFVEQLLEVLQPSPNVQFRRLQTMVTPSLTVGLPPRSE